jgi:hypothetical protein
MMQVLGPHLRPHHIVIHGTKGFDLCGLEEKDIEKPEIAITRANVRTMSEVVREESSVVRIGKSERTQSGRRNHGRTARRHAGGQSLQGGNSRRSTGA